MTQRLRGLSDSPVSTRAGSSPVSPTHSAVPSSLQMGLVGIAEPNERASEEGVLRKSATELARFWSYVYRDGPTPIHRPDLGSCWTWTGGKRGKGYGAFNMPKPDGGYRMVNAHRYAYEVSVARVPPELVVDHRCLNRLCCNPAHLEVVTNGENLRRGHLDRTTHCKHSHEYTDDNTMWSANRKRSCRACWLTLNDRQREALALLASYGGRGGRGFGSTGIDEGRVWINGATARALEARGLLVCHGEGEGAPVELIDAAEAA